MVMLTMMWQLGLLCGPALSGGFKQVNVRAGVFRLHQNTLPACFMILLNLVCVGLFCILFKDPPRDRSEAVAWDCGLCKRAWQVLQSSGAWHCVVTIFALHFSMNGLSAIVTPFTTAWNWDATDNSLYYVFLAGCGLLALGFHSTGVGRSV